MSSVLPNSSEFKRRILSLYYAIWLPGPAVLVASLFALLDITVEEWAWLCSFAVGYAVFASAIATNKLFSNIDPITTFLDHHSKDGVVSESARVNSRLPPNKKAMRANVSMTSYGVR